MSRVPDNMNLDAIVDELFNASSKQNLEVRLRQYLESLNIEIADKELDMTELGRSVTCSALHRLS